MNYKSLQEWTAKGTSHFNQISWKSCKILKAKNKKKYCMNTQQVSQEKSKKIKKITEIH
jgi:hypothetical protein